MTEAATAAWTALAALDKPGLQSLFADPKRLAQLSSKLDLPGGAIRFDWSKTHLDAAHIAAFEQLAKAMDFAGKRGEVAGGENRCGRAERATRGIDVFVLKLGVHRVSRW